MHTYSLLSTNLPAFTPYNCNVFPSTLQTSFRDLPVELQKLQNLQDSSVVSNLDISDIILILCTSFPSIDDVYHRIFALVDNMFYQDQYQFRENYLSLILDEDQFLSMKNLAIAVMWGIVNRSTEACSCDPTISPNSTTLAHKCFFCQVKFTFNEKCRSHTPNIAHIALQLPKTNILHTIE